MLERIKTKIRGTIDIERLKADGLIVGKNFNTQHGVIVDPGHCWLIEIGDNVTLAPRVHILAHDASTKIPLGYTKIGKVTIGNNVFIGASTIVLPNTKIGDYVIVGAGSLVSHDLPSGGVYCGNPCVKIADYDEWIASQRKRIDNSPKYDSSYVIGNITDEKKQQMKAELEKGIGFIV
jgi:maltose O-acetyltransferase